MLEDGAEPPGPLFFDGEMRDKNGDLHLWGCLCACLKVLADEGGSERCCGWRSMEEPFLGKALEEAAWRSSEVIVNRGVQESCGCDI